MKSESRELRNELPGRHVPCLYCPKMVALSTPGYRLLFFPNKSESILLMLNH